jgi:hypothetical protein
MSPTPGPWRLQGNTLVSDADPMNQILIASLAEGPQAQADGTLIRASASMLKALRLVIDAQTDEERAKAIKVARGAVALADDSAR